MAAYPVHQHFTRGSLIVDRGERESALASSTWEHPVVGGRWSVVARIGCLALARFHITQYFVQYAKSSSRAAGVTMTIMKPDRKSFTLLSRLNCGGCGPYTFSGTFWMLFSRLKAEWDGASLNMWLCRSHFSIASFLVFCCYQAGP